jgi:NADH-quinone oxidoreductase subunit N
MTLSDLIALGPLLAVAAGAVALLLTLCVGRSNLLGLAIALATLLCAMMLLPGSLNAASSLTWLLAVDGVTAFVDGVLLVAAFLVALTVQGQSAGPRTGEFFILLLLATLGAMVLAAANHFTTLVLGLELLSVSLYGLAAYGRTAANVEAGTKYLVLAGTSSAILLMGLALVYAASGQMGLSQLTAALGAGGAGLPLAGGAMVLVGVLFKLAVVPMHFWAPDVYAGAPAPAAALVASVSKGAMLALVLRAAGGLPQSGASWWTLTVLAVASMLGGNLLALLERDIKRLLAYSGVAHMGYMLTGVLVGSAWGLQSAAFYLGTYCLGVIGAFAVLAALPRNGLESAAIEDLWGLLWRSPLAGWAMAAAMLSLAGVPLTAGFMGKLMLLLAAAQVQHWLLALALVAGSVIGLFAYLRVLAATWRRGATEGSDKPLAGASIAAAVCALAIVAAGLWPAPLWRAVQVYFALARP